MPASQAFGLAIPRGVEGADAAGRLAGGLEDGRERGAGLEFRPFGVAVVDARREADFTS